MKTVIKKLLLITTLVCSCTLCGCSNKIDNKVTIQFASWGSKSEIEILEPLLKDFESTNPDIKVDFMHIPQNYFQKIHLLFASNTAPDVIFINNLYLPIYANAGVLKEIPTSSYQELKNTYYENSLKALSYKGKLYAIPRDVSNLVIYYNKDIFDKKHIPYPNSNWTLEDLIKIGQKLTDKDTFAISFEQDPMFFLPYLMSEGGGILSDNLDETIIDNPQSQKGLNFYTDLRKKYHIAPKKSESASATMAQMFLQERIAMHLSGRWLTPKYREEAKFKWDIVEFPKGSKGSIVPLDASGWSVSKSTKHPKEAEKLVEYLSSKESIEKLTQSGLIVPARKDVANSKYFLDKNSPEHAQVFLNVISTSKPTPVSVNYKEIIDNLSTELEKKFN